jgi:hypothetical protein
MQLLNRQIESKIEVQSKSKSKSKSKAENNRLVLSFPAILFFSGLLLYASACSAKPLAKKAGFGGVIGLNAGAIVSQSQLSVGDDNAQISDLNNSKNSLAPTETTVLPFPFFRADYTFTDLTTQIFFGQSKSNILNSALQYELGITHQFSNGQALTLAYIPHIPLLKDAWADPYLTGAPRQETDVDSSAVRLAYRFKPLTVKYAYGFYNLDDEQSGNSASLGGGQCDGQNCTAQEQALLDRNSRYQRVTVDSFVPLGSGIFTTPRAYYGRSDADGDSQSFIEYHYSLSVFTSFGPHFISLQGAYTDREYEEANPIFSQLQQDAVTRYMFIYSYDQPFRLANSKLNILYQHKTLDSNIKFFDSQQQFVSLGISYNF